MREASIGNYYIIYPEPIVWLHDNNIVRIDVPQNQLAGAKIRVATPIGNTRTLEYYSSTNSVTFILNDVLRAIYDQSITPLSLTIELDNGTGVTTLFTTNFRLLQGKSFTNRSHNVQTTMYLYHPDELTKLEVFSPSNGHATIGGHTFEVNEGFNALNLSQLITDEGTYTLCLSSADVRPVAIINSVDERVHSAVINLTFATGGGMGGSSKGGDIWEKVEVFPICHRLIYEPPCEDYEVFEIRYINADGCHRYMAGKLISETNKSEYTTYHRIDEQIYNNIPLAYMSGNTRNVKVAFDDVAFNAFFSDVLFSPELEYRNWAGEWVPCSLVTDSMVTDNRESNDYTLDFAISKQ